MQCTQCDCKRIDYVRDDFRTVHGKCTNCLHDAPLGDFIQGEGFSLSFTNGDEYVVKGSDGFLGNLLIISVDPKCIELKFTAARSSKSLGFIQYLKTSIGKKLVLNIEQSHGDDDFSGCPLCGKFDFVRNYNRCWMAYCACGRFSMEMPRLVQSLILTKKLEVQMVSDNELLVYQNEQLPVNSLKAPGIYRVNIAVVFIRYDEKKIVVAVKSLATKLYSSKFDTLLAELTSKLKLNKLKVIPIK